MKTADIKKVVELQGKIIKLKDRIMMMWRGTTLWSSMNYGQL